MSTTPAVAMHHVHKAFNANPALQGLNVVAPHGAITVLLGPNGAGKTTATRIVTGAMTPDSGSIRTLGLDPNVDGEEVRMQCGVVSAKPALYDRLSGWDNMRYSASLHDVDKRVADDRIRAAAGRFGIEHALNEQVGGYSTGMKTRLALARSVLHEPRLLLFDEPTSGLDPESAQAVLGLIREMTDDGHTVVMCTHHLVEAEGLADHIVVLDIGKDLVSGRPDELISHYWPDDSALIEIDGATDVLGDLTLIDYVHAAEVDGQVARVILDSVDRVPDLVAALSAAGVRLRRVVPHEPTLEELYFEVRRTARSAGQVETEVLA